MQVAFLGDSIESFARYPGIFSMDILTNALSYCYAPYSISSK